MMVLAMYMSTGVSLNLQRMRVQVEIVLREFRIHVKDRQGLINDRCCGVAEKYRGVKRSQYEYQMNMSVVWKLLKTRQKVKQLTCWFLLLSSSLLIFEQIIILAPLAS